MVVFFGLKSLHGKPLLGQILKKPHSIETSAASMIFGRMTFQGDLALPGNGYSRRNQSLATITSVPLPMRKGLHPFYLPTQSTPSFRRGNASLWLTPPAFEGASPSFTRYSSNSPNAGGTPHGVTPKQEKIRPSHLCEKGFGIAQKKHCLHSGVGSSIIYAIGFILYGFYPILMHIVCYGFGISIGILLFVLYMIIFVL